MKDKYMAIEPEHSEELLVQLIADHVSVGSTAYSISKALGKSGNWLKNRIEHSEVLRNAYTIHKLAYECSIRTTFKRVMVDDSHDKYSPAVAMKLIDKWDDDTDDAGSAIDDRDNTDDITIEEASLQILVDIGVK